MSLLLLSADFTYFSGISIVNFEKFHSGVFIVNLEHIVHIFVVIFLMPLNKQILDGLNIVALVFLKSVTKVFGKDILKISAVFS